MAKEHPVRRPGGREDLPPSAPSLPAEARRDTLVEDYLDHLCAPLVGVVPYEKRSELRHEWRAHLEALAEAHSELGAADEAALEAALRQFGDPDRLGREWVETHRDGPLRRLAPLVRAATGFGMAGAVWFGINAHAIVVAGLAEVGARPAPAGPAFPLLAGLLLGLLPNRHPLGGWRGLTALALLSAIITSAFTTPLTAADVPAYVGVMFLVQFWVWLMITCGGAGLGRLFRDWRSGTDDDLLPARR